MFPVRTTEITHNAYTNSMFAREYRRRVQEVRDKNRYPLSDPKDCPVFDVDPLIREKVHESIKYSVERGHSIVEVSIPGNPYACKAIYLAFKELSDSEFVWKRVSCKTVGDSTLAEYEVVNA